MRTIVLLLFLSLAQPRPPELTARWDGDTQARVVWESDAAWVCVYRYPKIGANVLLTCAQGGSGEIVLPWRDAAYKAMPGDRFCGAFDRAPLLCTAPLPWRRFLPVARAG